MPVRRLLLAVGLTVTAVGLSALAAPQASADSVADPLGTLPTSAGSIGPGTFGGAITTTQMIARADDWMNAQVPYSTAQESGSDWNFWSDDATGGPYRQDCSGFVSMAWDLSDSLVTWTLPQVATVTDGNISGDTNLNPGDALDYTADHVVLFDHWTDQSTGDFVYDAEHAPGQVTNQMAGNVYDSTLEGYSISDFEALRYNNIAPDSTSSLYADGSGGRVAAGVHADGRMEMFAVTASGGIDNRFEVTPNGAWSGWAAFGPNATVTSVATGRHQDGRLEVFAVLNNGAVENKYETSPDGAWSGWNDYAPAGTAKSLTVGLHASGRMEVFAVTPSGGVQNKYETSPNGAWSGWNGFGPSGTVDSVAAATHADGRLEVFAVMSDGSMQNKYETTPDGTWSSWAGYAPAGTADGTGSPGTDAAGVHADGRVEVYAVTPSGGVENKYETKPDAAWSGWNGFGPNATVTAVATARHADGRLEVFAVLKNGSIENKFETTPGGTWSGWNGYAATGFALA